MSGFENRRILFFLNWLRGGAGMINREVAFAKEIVARGGSVRLLSHFEPEMDVPGIQTDVLVRSSFKDRWYNHWLTRRIVDRRAKAVFDAFKPEIIFTDLPVEAERSLRLRPENCRVAYTYHGTADGSAYDAETARQLAEQRAFSHRMLAAVDQPIVVSDYLLPEAREAGVQAARLYNGVDLDHWRPAGDAPASPPHVLFVGRYTECKGALQLVQAFVRATRDVPRLERVELVMHGFFERPDYEAKIQAEIAASGMSERIHMNGPLDWADLPAAINRCTVFANGSVDESFCMPFLEAQACGRACAGFDSRGIPEVVRHGVTGFLAPPGDVDAFAAHLRTLLVDDVLRAQCETAARAHAETFNYSLLTDELAIIVENMMRKDPV